MENDDSLIESDNLIDNDKLIKNEKQERKKFASLVGKKQKRMLKAKAQKDGEIWLTFNTFGVIGWSIVVPVLLGTAAGLFLDHHYPSTHSWTIALMVAGLAAGCFSSWRWIDEQSKDLSELDDEGEIDK